jgi:AAA15 family ATPase/GTPase
MPAASSLVRSLGGFDAYLRLFAAPGDLILIDEPEMNAHPDAQLVLAEILGLLVNSSVNVILTTHSPYIIDHINNLLGASNVPLQKQDELAKQFKLQRKEAFLKSADVAGYLFGEQGDVKLASNAETEIDWSTFGAVSEQVTNLYPEILSASGWE